MSWVLLRNLGRRMGFVVLGCRIWTVGMRQLIFRVGAGLPVLMYGEWVGGVVSLTRYGYGKSGS